MKMFTFLIIINATCNNISFNSAKKCELLLPSAENLVKSCDFLPLANDSIRIWKNYAEGGWIFAAINIDSSQLNNPDFQKNSIFKLQPNKHTHINSLYLYTNSQLNFESTILKKDLLAVSIFIYDSDALSMTHFFYKKDKKSGNFFCDESLTQSVNIISLNDIYDISKKVLKQTTQRSIIAVNKTNNPELSVIKKKEHFLTSAIKRF